MVQFNNKPNKGYNTEDGFIYNSRSAAVVNHVLVKHNNNYYVLIGKRGTGGDNPGKLNLPCGYLDWNENLKDAARRELFEETGFILDNYTNKIKIQHIDQPWFVNTEITQNRQNIALHIGVIIQLNDTDELPVLSLDNMEENEVEWVKWMTYDEIGETLDDDWAFEHKKYIEKYRLYMVLKKN